MCYIVLAEKNRFMNNESNLNPSQPGESQPQGSTNGGCSPLAGHGVLEPLRSAMNAGTDRAKAAAEKAVPIVKAAVTSAAYWIGFGVSFATVFSYTVIKELAPESLKAGCRDGTQAGRKVAEDLGSKLGGQGNTATPPGAETGSAISV